MAKKLSYSEKLRDPRWQKKRLQVMERDDWECRLCGDGSTTLNIHHLSYHGDPWDSPDDELICICEHCHSEVEQLKDDDSFKNHSALDFYVYKSDHWQNKHRIMFFKSKKNGVVSMVTYDSSGKWVVGFNFGEGEADAIKLFFT